MASRKPPTVTSVRDDECDLGATQESIEAELLALQEGLERIKQQLAERRTLDAALRALVGLSKRKSKVPAAVKTRAPARGKKKP